MENLFFVLSILRADRDAEFRIAGDILLLNGHSVPDAVYITAAKVQFLADQEGLTGHTAEQLAYLWRGLLASGNSYQRAELIAAARQNVDLKDSAASDDSVEIWKSEFAVRVRQTHAVNRSVSDDVVDTFIRRLADNWSQSVMSDSRWCQTEAPLPWLEPIAIADSFTELGLIPKSAEQLLSAGDSFRQLSSRHLENRFASMPIDFVLDRLRRTLLLVGAPGSGKTTLTKWLVRMLLTRSYSRFLLPIHIPLRQYCEEKRQNPQLTLLGFFWRQLGLSDDEARFWDNMTGAWRSPPDSHSHWQDTVLLLLDGWDEVPTTARPELTGEVNELLGIGPAIVTSRPSAFPGDIPFEHRFEIHGLPRDGVYELVMKWFLAHGQQTQADDLLEHIGRYPDLSGLATNPFLLTLLCGIGLNADPQSSIRLPSSRTELYQQTLDGIFRQHEHRFGEANAITPSRQRGLERLSYWLLKDADGAPRYVFDAQEVNEFLGEADVFERVVQPARLVNRVLFNVQSYQFLHATFQEFLAARQWLRDSRENSEVLAAGVFNSAWLEVIRFAAGQPNNDETGFWNALREVAETPDRFGFVFARLASCVAESGATDGGRQLIGVDLRVELWDRFIASEESPIVDNLYVDAHLDVDSEDFLRRLRNALHNADPVLTARLMHAIDRAPGAVATDLVTDLLTQPDETARRMAQHYADKLDRNALRQIRDIAVDESRGEDERRTALFSLSYARDFDSIPALAAMAAEKSALAGDALEAIGDIGGRRATNALIELFQSADDGSDEKGYAIYALGGANTGEARDFILREIASGEWDADSLDVLLSAVQGVPISDGAGMIVEFTAPEWPGEVRGNAVHVLSECTDPAVDSAVFELARNDQDDDIRLIALQAMLWRRDPANGIWLSEHFHDTDRTTEERLRCLDVLVETASHWRGFVNGKEVHRLAVEAVRSALKCPDSVEAAGAARNAHLLSSEIAERLIQVCDMNGASAEVRCAACQSLGVLAVPAAAESLAGIVERFPNVSTQELQTQEFEDIVTEEAVATSAAEALAIIDPLRLMEIRGSTSDDALIRYSALHGTLIYSDYVVDAAGHVRGRGKEQQPPITEETAAPNAGNVFRPVGEFWEIVWEGERTLIRALIGLSCIHRLLQQPEVPISVFDLDQNNLSSTSPWALSTAELQLSSLDLGSDHDQHALQAYHRRLIELASEIDAAEKASDNATKDRLTEEKEAINTVLSGSLVNYRRSPEAEKVRKRVSRNISTALGKIEALQPLLHRHLEISLEVGFECVYRPETATHWST